MTAWHFLACIYHMCRNQYLQTTWSSSVTSWILSLGCLDFSCMDICALMQWNVSLGHCFQAENPFSVIISSIYFLANEFKFFPRIITGCFLPPRRETSYSFHAQHDSLLILIKALTTTDSIHFFLVTYNLVIFSSSINFAFHQSLFAFPISSLSFFHSPIQRCNSNKNLLLYSDSSLTVLYDLKNHPLTQDMASMPNKREDSIQAQWNQCAYWGQEMAQGVIRSTFSLTKGRESVPGTQLAAYIIHNSRYRRIQSPHLASPVTSHVHNPHRRMQAKHPYT